MHGKPADGAIAGDLTRLTPASEAHLPLLARWFADPEFVRNWGGQPFTREEVAAKYTGRRRPDVESFLILAQNVPVGYVQYVPSGTGQGGIDMVLVPHAQGRGLGPDAARALVRHLHTVLGWNRVTVDPEASNIHAVRAWAKAGFQPVSRQGSQLLMACLPAPGASPAQVHDGGFPSET
ncbi:MULTISPECIES: GNAT family N-acetyltransferase [unclassified Streptomyces]|uniref:GNAT family N-acetyltransferase n=1 Tax=unclassified Streptomyces TaxID=2593676 RepID=UPI0001C1CA87|nr:MULTISPECIES: GNAT family N-acetyltransferase [unclassified Streptomyces]AEN12149.1 GCN5-related N-acetyltransferase [Streptomyces sp. SirexAA-E]MYR68142.1 GNAT family N-acetyltransferase [Streptomyces sp. SID4939]MYR99871.1 GNAT family N-acetyltransferase [Streptomyces sp. SID4940]MYT63310.1 GNAT family N-acetyltransferase [Streptomyces sp. SID8357]MYT88414.1 GNAT family N-acetyltransferase [Streptomyces sp. SID8360]